MFLIFATLYIALQKLNLVEKSIVILFFLNFLSSLLFYRQFLVHSLYLGLKIRSYLPNLQLMRLIEHFHLVFLLILLKLDLIMKIVNLILKTQDRGFKTTLHFLLIYYKLLLMRLNVASHALDLRLELLYPLSILFLILNPYFGAIFAAFLLVEIAKQVVVLFF